jgi:CDP-2,3-bis-(O-geranylgeranyl)-sn-glycerol synthase
MVELLPTVVDLILTSLYFFLPAYFANMAPVIFKKLPLGQPISKKYLGKNKTWRGLIAGTIMGGIIFWAQKVLYEIGFQAWALIDYSDFTIGLGLLMGLGALVGDAVESYYKRKAGLKPGCPWIPFDQIDFVIGGVVLCAFVYVPPAEIVLVLLIISPCLHIAVNHIAFWLGIRKEKW